MGSLYRPKYRNGEGHILESGVWWAQYRLNGRTLRQSTQSTKHEEAKRVLRRIEGKIADGKPVNPAADRISFREMAEAIRQDYEIQRRKSRGTLEHRLANLEAFFGAMRMAQITTAHVERYKHQRLQEASPATTNRELACLSRMFHLGRKRGIFSAPEIEYVEERNVREGFFEDHQFEAVCRRLPEHLRSLAATARITGWRKSEVKSREWPHVDLQAGWLRMEPGETKNDEGRMFPLIPELRAILEAQRSKADTLQRQCGRIIPHVFFRPDGKPVGDFKRAWHTACRKAGVPERFFHDFRRTAVRNLIRAGIPEAVAMKMTGHKTNAVFKRYAIVDEGMLREASEKLAFHFAGPRTLRRGMA